MKVVSEEIIGISTHGNQCEMMRLEHKFLKNSEGCNKEESALMEIPEFKPRLEPIAEHQVSKDKCLGIPVILVLATLASWSYDREFFDSFEVSFVSC